MRSQREIKPASGANMQAVRVSIPARIHVTVRAEPIINTAAIGPYALGAGYADGSRRRGKVVRRFGDRAWRLAIAGEGGVPV